MRFDVKVFEVRPAGQVHRGGLPVALALLLAQDVSDRSGTRRALEQGFLDSGAQILSTVVIEQQPESRSHEGGGLAALESLFQKGLGLGHHGDQEGGWSGGQRPCFLDQQRIYVSLVLDPLMPAIGASMTRHLGGAIEDSDLRVGSKQREWPAYECMRNRIVVLVEADIDGLGRSDRAHEVGVEGMDRQFHQSENLLRESLFNRHAVVLGPWPLGGDFTSPHQCLAIEVGQSSEGTGGEERIPDESNDSFDSAFLIAPRRTAGPWSEVIVRGQLDESRIEMDRASKALHHGRAQVVVQDDPGDPAQIREGADVTPQETLHTLIERELQVKRARIREGHDETGQISLCRPNRDLAEAGPVRLRLFSRKDSATQECLLSPRPYFRHFSPDLTGGARKAALLNHLKESRRSQLWMLLQRLTNELHIRIHLPRSRRRQGPDH